VCVCVCLRVQSSTSDGGSFAAVGYVNQQAAQIPQVFPQNCSAVQFLELVKPELLRKPFTCASYLDSTSLDNLSSDMLSCFARSCSQAPGNKTLLCSSVVSLLLVRPLIMTVPCRAAMRGFVHRFH